MRASEFFFSTLKEAPSEAELINHRLMLRAGLIRRLASGLYSWMPMGLRVLRKIEAIVREEMNASGAIELLMPAVQPAELWQESGRWEFYGAELLRLKDRHQRDFCFGPTHEEVITDIARREIRSYRQLPLNFYQIQTKFRDEIRPRFGVMRAREFIMKDAYSFHANFDSLAQTYQRMFETYMRIFTRLGLKFRAVAADTGAIGGSASHEFHVLADSGEDAIAFCLQSDYAANVELAEALAPPESQADAAQLLQKVATPDVHRVEEVCAFLKLSPQQTLKTLLLEDAQGILIALLLRGDHDLNLIKATQLSGVNAPLRFASDSRIFDACGCKPGSLGPVGLSMRIVADHSAAAMSDFICGANEEGFHLSGVNFGRDLPAPEVADLRNVVTGDASPDGKGTLEICRGIEVGHIFQLRTKYSQAMKATYLDEKGAPRNFEMGCYGIGVSRIVGAAIEQNHDEKGIKFPAAIAPFELAIAPLGGKKSQRVRQSAEKLYTACQEAGIDVLLDDRDERPGVLFADLELIGIPHRVVVGERGLESGQFEYVSRSTGQTTMLQTSSAVAELLRLIRV